MCSEPATAVQVAAAAAGIGHSCYRLNEVECRESSDSAGLAWAGLAVPIVVVRLKPTSVSPPDVLVFENY